MVIGCEIHILLKHRFCWRNHSPLQVASWHSCNGGGSHWNNHHGGDHSLKKTFHKCIHVHVAIEGLMVSFIHNPKLPAHHWVCMAVETVILLFTSVYFPWLLDTEGTCLFLVMLKDHGLGAGWDTLLCLVGCSPKLPLFWYSATSQSSIV